MTEWPDDALRAQARVLGPAVLRLIDSEDRWIHRRIERMELVSATLMTRTVTTELTVPMPLSGELALYPDSSRTGDEHRYLIPLGTLPKGALQDFRLLPDDAHRLTAGQTNPLMVAALTPYARRSGAPAHELLSLCRRIIRGEEPQPALREQVEALLDSATGDPSARDRLYSMIRTLDESYVLLAAVKADPGLPLRVTYTHQQVVVGKTGEVTDPPLIVEAPLPYGSGPGPAYRVEVVAPDGLEVETASIVAVEGEVRRPIESVNTERGEGAFAQLRAPDTGRPPIAGLQATFGWPAGGIQHVASIAGAATTAALLAATAASFVIDAGLKGSAAGTLLAAPALVTSLALGFATTRVTSAAVNRLRLAALATALIGVAGALTLSLLAEDVGERGTLRLVLILCTVTALLITAGWPGRAALRDRASVPLDPAP